MRLQRYLTTARLWHDDYVGEAALLLHVEQEIHELGLHGDIEGRDRFVQHHQLGLQDDGPGQGDPLALPAAELVGIEIGTGGRQADVAEHLRHFLFDLAPGELEVDLQGLGQDAAHPHARVQGAVGVLEHGLFPSLRERVDDQIHQRLSLLLPACACFAAQVGSRLSHL